jgi:type VI secretion system protein ImpD
LGSNCFGLPGPPERRAAISAARLFTSLLLVTQLPVPVFDLEDVLRETAAPSAPSGRLRCLAAERDWVKSLVGWLGLAEGDPVPSRRSIVGRLTLEIAAIDRLVGQQLDEILHHAAFQRLEASWRGLHGLHLLRSNLVGNQDHLVVLRVLDLSWSELTRDIERAPEFDMSRIFDLVYSQELDTPGGTPYGVLIGDYFVTHRRSKEHRDDIGTLRGMGQVAAASFCPFVTGADPTLLDLEAFTELERPMDLARTFRSDDYVAWNSLRQLEDSRFLALTLPRTLMRRSYRDDATRVDGFRYAESVAMPPGRSSLWGNASYAFGEVLIRAFVESGWMAAIRGVDRDAEGRGLVTELAHEWHAPERRGVVSRGSLEVQLTETQEHELGELGFIPLLHCNGTRYSAFYSNQSLQDWRVAVPSAARNSAAGANAKLSSMLQYMFCVSRFAHYVKVLAREKVGSFTSTTELQRMLSSWLLKYATANVGSTAEAQAKYPLRDARVEVLEKPGSPGAYTCRVHLQPHYQLDQLATAISLSTDLYTGHEI